MAPQTKQTVQTSGCLEPKMRIPDAMDHHPLPLCVTHIIRQKMETLMLNTYQTSQAAWRLHSRPGLSCDMGFLSALGGPGPAAPFSRPLQPIALLLQFQVLFQCQVILPLHPLIICNMQASMSSSSRLLDKSWPRTAAPKIFLREKQSGSPLVGAAPPPAPNPKACWKQRACP